MRWSRRRSAATWPSARRTSRSDRPEIWRRVTGVPCGSWVPVRRRPSDWTPLWGRGSTPGVGRRRCPASRPAAPGRADGDARPVGGRGRPARGARRRRGHRRDPRRRRAPSRRLAAPCRPGDRAVRQRSAVIADGPPTETLTVQADLLAAQGVWVPGLPDPEPLLLDARAGRSLAARRAARRGFGPRSGAGSGAARRSGHRRTGPAGPGEPGPRRRSRHGRHRSPAGSGSRRCWRPSPACCARHPAASWPGRLWPVAWSGPSELALPRAGGADRLGRASIRSRRSSPGRCARRSWPVCGETPTTPSDRRRPRTARADGLLAALGLDRPRGRLTRIGSPGASSAGWRWRPPWRRGRRCCSSTSRPSARTVGPGPPSREPSRRRGPPARPSPWRPTTAASSPPSPTPSSPCQHQGSTSAAGDPGADDSTRRLAAGAALRTAGHRHRLVAGPGELGLRPDLAGRLVTLAVILLLAPLAARARCAPRCSAAVPGTLAALSIGWSTWLLGDRDVGTAVAAGLRILVLVLPGSLLVAQPRHQPARRRPGSAAAPAGSARGGRGRCAATDRGPGHDLGASLLGPPGARSRRAGGSPLARTARGRRADLQPARTDACAAPGGWRWRWTPGVSPGRTTAPGPSRRAGDAADTVLLAVGLGRRRAADRAECHLDVICAKWRRHGRPRTFSHDSATDPAHLDRVDRGHRGDRVGHTDRVEREPLMSARSLIHGQGHPSQASRLRQPWRLETSGPGLRGPASEVRPTCPRSWAPWSAARP